MIDLSALEGRMTETGVGVVKRWVGRGADEARRRAPVRKVFQGQGGREQVRAKSIEEIEGDRELRARLGLGPEYGPLNTRGVPPATVLTRFAPQELGQRRVTRPPRRMAIPGAQERLDRRGRYELRTGRAIHQQQLGGRLRREIYAGAVIVEGVRITARIVSPTRYAKYQELGTRHHPAHPYMRPAGYVTVEGAKTDARRSYTATVRQGLRAVVPVKAVVRVTVA